MKPEITFKNRTNKIEAAEIRYGNVVYKINGEDARILASKMVDERFNPEKLLQNCYITHKNSTNLKQLAVN